MKAATLVREKLAPKVKEFNPELVELATKAYLCLGYEGLYKAVVLHPPTLSDVLRELEIEPFSEKSVEKYKAQIIEEVEKETRKSTRSTKRSKVAKKRKYDDEDDDSSDEGDVTYRWRRIKLSQYSKPIPEFVLSKAVQIVQKLPNVQVAVEELVAEVPDPDPFLVVSHENEKFYIEVWDEPKFEAKVLQGITVQDTEDYDDE